MKLVFICSPYKGDVEHNVKQALKHCQFAVKQGVAPFAPHLLYPQILDDSKEAERSLGLEFGIKVLSKCDQLWAFGDSISGGMAAEIVHAKKLGIPVRRFSTNYVEEL